MFHWCLATRTHMNFLIITIINLNIALLSGSKLHDSVPQKNKHCDQPENECSPKH